MSTISASTTSTTAYKVTADTTGALVLQTGSGPTTAVTVDTSQNVTVAGNLTLNNGAADGAQLTLSSSGYSNWNIDNYSGSLRAYYNATEYLKVSATGDLQFNSGYGSVATAYGCRAWVNFNGTGTVAIRASGNVSSITDNGTGDYTVNFTTAMPDANYAGSGSANLSTGVSWVSLPYSVAPTTTAVRMATVSGGLLADFSYVYAAIFR